MADGPRKTPEHESVLNALVNSCFVGALLFPIWYYLDWQVISAWPQETDRTPALIACAILRLIVVLFMLIYIYAVLRVLGRPERSEASQKALIKLGAVAQQVAGLGIIAIIWVVDGFAGQAGNYFGGLVMVFIVIALLTPWRSTYTILQISILTAAYAVAGLVYYRVWKDESVPFDAQTNMLFITGAAILCSYGAWMRDPRSQTSTRTISWRAVFGYGLLAGPPVILLVLIWLL